MRSPLPGVAVAGMLGLVLATPVTPLPASAAAPAWQVTPAGLPSISRLQDVTAAGPSAAWAVGYQNYSFEPPAPGLQLHAVQRWNGSAWSAQRLPGDPADLTGVSAAGRSDVWVVGTGGSVPYAARFDGSGWTAYRPAGDDSTTTLRDVAAGNGRAVFVGGRFPNPKIVEWTGREFTDVPVTVPDTWANELLSVSSAPDGSTFAVGSRYGTDGSGPYPLIVQRLGGTWRVATVPAVRDTRLLSVSARSATDVWAVGTADDSLTRRPVIMHFDGRSWREVTAPLQAASLLAVAVDTAGTVWITGGNEPGGETRYLRYSAGRWTVENGTRISPAYGSGSPSVQGLTAVPGSPGRFWGVGAAVDAVQGDVAVIARRG